MTYPDPSLSMIPPYRPDPDLVDNIEGNKRLIKADRKKMQKTLEEAIAADRAAGRLPEDG